MNGNSGDIAVIGIGLDISNATTLNEYWKFFDDNIDCIREMPEHRKQQISDYARLYLNEDESARYFLGSFLEHIDQFDNEFFRISPREAQTMDPVQRILLQTIFHTFDDAGYTREKLAGSQTGIYIGYTSGAMKDNYFTNIMFAHPELLRYSIVGNMAPILPSRASHLLDLHGPTMLIDTACSASLVAIHEACEAIQRQSCSMAIAGGIKINLLPLIIESMMIGIESNDGRTRAFDDYADGAGIGEGAACVLLKPLRQAEADGDNIYAVIKGTAINNDGKSSSITAPNPASQAKVILSTWEKAGIHPEQIDYIETHGTGTLLGDPVEFQGLSHAFEAFTDKKQFCALSSAKSNIGHLFECAGVASFIKAVAALKFKRIPGMRNFLTPNKNIDFCDSPFYINTKAKHWEQPRSGTPRTCGISAFGLSGTNCHVVVQEYTETGDEPAYDWLGGVLCLSAKSEYSLKHLIQDYAAFIANTDASINRVTACANLYREHMPKRIAIVYTDQEDLLNKLQAVYLRTPDQWLGIGGVLYNPNAEIGSGDSEKIISALQRCNDIVRNQDSGGEDELLLLLEFLAGEYCNRSVVDWSVLYQGMAIPKIPLPHYPFQPTAAWLPSKERTEQPRVKREMRQAAEIVEPNSFNEEHFFYERSFVEAELPTFRYYKSTCLFIYREDHKHHELLGHLRNQFLQVKCLPISMEKASGQGASRYLAAVYREVDFSEISHILLATDERSKRVANGDDLSAYVQFQMFSVIELYKHIRSVQHQISIVSLSDSGFAVTGTEEYLRPESTCIFGLGKSFNREYRNLHMCTVDLDAATDLRNVTQEICSETSQARKDIVLYREGRRYIEGLREKTITEDKGNLLRDEGVYLITGGLGGIGFETALGIARKVAGTSLVLAGRSMLEDESEWADILQSEAASERGERIRRMQRLRQYAGSVQYIQCDISDEDSVQDMIEVIGRKYGKLNGIVHSAGVGGGTALEHLDEARVMSIVRPKIIGTFLLDIWTRRFNPDFFVMYSSNSTFFSSSDLPDYIAGNLYLDAYSSYRSASCSGLSLTVNWATWLETGMSVKHNFTVDTLTRSIRTKDAISALFTAMNNGSGSLMIAQLNFQSKIVLLMHKYPLVLSPNISASLEKLNASSDIPGKAGLTSFVQEMTGTGGYSKTEKVISGICCKVLGYEDIDIFKNFFELGADSIMLALILRELNEVYPGKLKVTDLFSFPTVKALSEYIASITDHLEDSNLAAEEEVELNFTSEEEDRDNEEDDYNQEGVAIIGVGLELPNASDLPTLWNILSSGINVVRDIPETRSADIIRHLKNQGMVDEQLNFRKMGYMDQINQFDYSFFGMSPRESTIIDPVNRLFLQCSAKAIDDSGYGRIGVKGTDTAIFLGYSASNCNTYSRLLYETDQTLFNDSLPVNQVSMAASRVAYVYDLKGPSMVVDTACSSSLVALHMACEEIREGKCQMALAGGAFIAHMPLDNGCDVGFESKESITRAFSQDSSGSAIAEGVGVIMLKSLKQALADKDDIYAVIRGSATNQDGSSFGIAAPNFQAQSQAIQEAWRRAGVGAEDIAYIEAHGTGTQLGDPIEVTGIKHAFETATSRKQICGIGSIKTNLGHANEAAGMCGIFKLIGILQHKQIPPSLYFKTPNSNIDFVDSPLYVVDHKIPLQKINGRYIVGISGFGMSGTNAHVVLENAPKRKKIKHSDRKAPYIFAASAKSKESLRNLLADYRQYLLAMADAELFNFCCNLTLGRSHYHHRLAFVADSRTEMISRLEQALGSEMAACEGGYVGQYAIVSESKTYRYPHEITINEQQALTRLGADIIEAGTGYDWDKLTELYVRGAEINWVNIYSGPYDKMHLPVYVFEKNKCWYPIPDAEEQSHQLNSYFHAKKWVPLKQDKYLELQEDTYTLIIYDKTNYDSSFSEAVEAKCRNVISVITDDEWEYMSSSQVVRMPAGEANYQKLFEELSGKRIEHIIHRRSISSAHAMDLDAINHALELGFFDLISVFKGLAKAHVEQDIAISILSNSAYGISSQESFTLPHNAVTLGLGKVIEQENPTISCRAIDMDLNTNHELIAEEVFADHNIYLVGFRNNERYVEEFSDVEITTVQQNRFKPGGVYLVTGGTDGLGLETAKYISEHDQCNIVLLSRSGFLNEALWPEYEHEEEYASRIKILKEIKGNGCQLDIYACDVCDYNALNDILQQIRTTYGKIDGIFHSAGISGAGYILRKEMDSYLSVMAPKIAGTWNLDQLTAEDHLDFMVLYSSGVTDGGEAGQSDYLGANAFLDAYTDYRNACHRNTYTINWCSWKETGMSYRYGVNVDSITKAMSTQEAVQALDIFIRGVDHKRVMIGQYNINDNFFALMQHTRNHLASGFKQKIETNYSEASLANGRLNLNNGLRDFAQIRKGRIVFIPKSEKVKSRLDSVKDFKLEGDPANQYSEIEHEVARVYSGILGYEHLNVYDNFFEMGGDSVMLATMYDMLDEMYPNIIRVAFLFEYCSIRSLAAFIDSKIKKEPEQVESGYLPDIRSSEEKPYFELSSPQARIYLEHRLRKGEFTYNNPFFINVSGIDDIELVKLLEALVKRHDMLRTTFKVIDNKLVQYIAADVPIHVDSVDVPSGTAINYSNYLKEFKLSEAPLFHLTVFNYSHQRILFFDIHHILLDGYSSSILQKDFADLAAHYPEADVRPSYRKYVEFEKAFFVSDEYHRMKSYWQDRLHGFEFSNPLSAISHSTGLEGADTIVKLLPDTVLSGVSIAAREHQTTMFNVLIACFAFSVSQTCGVHDLAILTTVLNRYESEFNSIVGVFTNLIPMRFQIYEHQPIEEYLSTAKKNQIGDLQNQYYQYHHLIGDFKQRQADFRLYFNFEDHSMKKVIGEDIAYNSLTPLFDLDINIKKRNGQFELIAIYKAELYSKNDIECIIHRYLDVLQLVTETYQVGKQ
ncbi:SDR family NAD(P)-dependent oxidoreductase [Paenibacillus sp. GCM10012306]|uniref:SDR family NAD(P)-dependent oxidoreductase n=1 Tax=Paenibacillus sp. GCM10012306 TaxID=3317342 RepID=UPI003623258E